MPVGRRSVGGFPFTPPPPVTPLPLHVALWMPRAANDAVR